MSPAPVRDPVPVDRIKAAMRGQIESAFEAWSHRPDVTEFRALRLSVPVQSLDVYDWVALQPGEVKLLWSGREDDWCAAGVGTADVVSGSHRDAPEALFKRCSKYVKQHPAMRYYGGFAFRGEVAGDPSWFRFGAALLVLPRFELVDLGNGQTQFCCNLLFRRDRALSQEDIQRDLDALVFEPEVQLETLPKIIGRRDIPDEMAWNGSVLSALDLLDRDVLEKVVLARKATFEFSDRINPFTLISHLRHVTSNCYHFCFQPAPGTAFMGTTPERLFRREGTAFTTEALAGTRPRGTNEEEDRQLQEALLNSEKDLLEHQIVVKSIRQRTHLLCKKLEMDEAPELLQLERKQHLVTRVSGHLADSVTDGQIMEQLHPTPAVGGYPRENALAEIERLEPFCRGWYAGPIGWIGRHGSEFAVAIRSGLVEKNKVSVFSGAGIVKGSTPEEEWAEIEQKISDFTKVTSLSV